MTVWNCSKTLLLSHVSPKVCVNADTGRTEKICVSTLSKLSCQYSDLAQEYSSTLSRCITFLSEVAGIKYAKEKLAKEIPRYRSI